MIGYGPIFSDQLVVEAWADGQRVGHWLDRSRGGGETDIFLCASCNFGAPATTTGHVICEDSPRTTAPETQCSDPIDCIGWHCRAGDDRRRLYDLPSCSRGRRRRRRKCVRRKRRRRWRHEGRGRRLRWTGGCRCHRFGASRHAERRRFGCRPRNRCWSEHAGCRIGVSDRRRLHFRILCRWCLLRIGLFRPVPKLWRVSSVGEVRSRHGGSPRRACRLHRPGTVRGYL